MPSFSDLLRDHNAIRGKRGVNRAELTARNDRWEWAKGLKDGDKAKLQDNGTIFTVTLHKHLRQTLQTGLPAIDLVDGNGRSYRIKRQELVQRFEAVE